MKHFSMKNRIWKYLFSGLVCVSITGTFIYQANAYYMNTSAVKLSCEKQTVLPTSNLLKRDSQKVLLGTWDVSDTSKKEVLVNITLSGGISLKEGYLSFDTESEVIKAELLNSDLSAVDLQEKISINVNETKTYKLRLSLTGQSISESSDELINVTWKSVDGEVLQADFVLPLHIEQEAATEVIPEEVETENTESIVDMLLVSSNVLKTNPLLLTITFPEGSEQIEIGTNLLDSEGEFPPFTRYTADGGESYTVLSEGGKIYLNSSDYEGKSLLQIDLSACDMEWKDAVYNIYSSSSKEGVWSEIQTDEMSTGSLSTETFTVSTNSYPAIVSKNENLVWNVISSTSKVEYSLEVLTKDGYKEVSDENLKITSSLSNGQGSITISSSEGKALAGTYRMTVNQLHDGVKTGSKEVVFFVNYR